MTLKLVDARRDSSGKSFKIREGAVAQSPILIFVGSCAVFSERLLDVVRSEFKDTEVLQLESIMDLRQFDPVMRAAVELVIVDETATSALSEVMRYLEHFEPGIGPVVAYRSVEKARSFLAQSYEASSLNHVQFLPMNTSVEAWITSLRLLVLGEAFIPSELLQALDVAATETNTEPENQALLHEHEEVAKTECPELLKLTKREHQIIALVSQGQRNQAIAKELGLSIHTVKIHVHNIFGKLGVDNRISASNKFRAHCSSL